MNPGLFFITASNMPGTLFPYIYRPGGWGMSIMQALVQMPFIAVFGLTSFALRLPAAILGCITLYAFYYICRSVKNEEFALFATFILAVMPWHIMQSRWALDCNYFAGFITISIALLIKASVNNKFLPLAFFFIGATLYTYALPWTVMPLFVLGSIIYLLCSKSIKNQWCMIGSIAILALMALPLLLFIAVNMNLMHEVVTPFISIPKISHFRSDELSLSPKTMMSHLTSAFNMFVKQDDGTLLGTTAAFGLYYKISGIFILIGLAECIYSFFSTKKMIGNEVYIILLFICSIIIAASTEIYFYRMNIIQIPMTFFLVGGLWYLTDIFTHRSKEVVIVMYSILCFFFIIFYITDYDSSVAKFFNDGNKAAIEYVKEQRSSGALKDGNTVHVVSGMSFTAALFYEQYPTDKYVKEVVYGDTSVTGVRELAQSFGDYHFYYNETLPETPKAGDIFICEHDDADTIEYMEAHNMQINHFTNMVVGTMP